jgi:ElaB/YqjD/DUF883 family membrane-anchored ribosome-binding protein
MQQSKGLAGAADAIERSKNAGSEFAEEAKGMLDSATDHAKQAVETTRDAAQAVASDASEYVSDAYRAGGYYARRYPLESLAAVAVIAFALGCLVRR